MAKILFTDMHNNRSLSRLPALFAEEGDTCAGLAFENDLLLRTNALQTRFAFPQEARNGPINLMANALGHAQSTSPSQFLLTNDELLLKNMLRLQENLKSGKGNLTSPQQNLLTLLDASFLKDGHYYSRARTQDSAQNAGFSVPQSAIAKNWDDLPNIAKDFGYPFYLKLCFEGGGQGVRLVSNLHDLEQAVLSHQSVGIIIYDNFPALLQKPSAGEELSVNFAAWQGKLLGYDVVKPLVRVRENGPSSVLQSVYRPDWEKPIRSLVQDLEYTGFGGLDVFERASDKLPDVIEVNLRPTHSLQVSHLIGSSLVKRFSSSLNNRAISDEARQIHLNRQETVALFPDEILRDKNSSYLTHHSLNVPWNDVRLLQAFFATIGLMGKN